MSGIVNLYKTVIRERWEIGFVEGGLDTVMGDVPIKVNWLKHKYKDRWFADPFILDVTETEIIVLVEEYQYKTNKGRIAELIVDKQSYVLKELHVILELDTHLSFPAIMRDGGRVFVYPESWGTGNLAVYEYIGRGIPMKKWLTVCDDYLADAVISELFGKRQLFAVQQNDILRVYDFCKDKCKFLFVKEMDFGIATARNGGDFFEYGGRIFRPAQVCVNCYGEAIEIQEVVEENGGLCFNPIKRLYSPHTKLKTGMHTLNCNTNMVVIDVHGYVYPRIGCAIKRIKSFLGKM